MRTMQAIFRYNLHNSQSARLPRGGDIRELFAGLFVHSNVPVDAKIAVGPSKSLATNLSKFCSSQVPQLVQDVGRNSSRVVLDEHEHYTVFTNDRSYSDYEATILA